MKFWRNDHTFRHPWDTVVKAVWQKYPNPITLSIKGVDVVDRSVDNNGILKTKRLMKTAWRLPAMVETFIKGDAYGFEYSEVDHKNKKFTVKTKNVTFSNYITIEESLVYTPHQDDQSLTHLRQEAVVKVKGIPLSSYFESVVTDTLTKNADKGRQAMEWVIEHLKAGCTDLRQEAQKCIDNMAATTGSSI